MACFLRRIAIPGGRGRLVGFLILVGFAVLLTGDSRERPIRAEPLAPQVEEPIPQGASQPNNGAANVVRQGFPAAKADPNNLAKSDSAWEVEWELTHPMNQPFYPPGSALRIKSAKFMWKDRLGKPRWIVVARMLECAEIYVPYDNGWTAFLDIHDMTFHITPARKEFLGPSCVLPGEILKSSNPYWSETVHKEVHDDGIRWMSAEADYRNQIADRARRGEKMILWSTYYGANYRYLMEYTFADDGMISCRLGATGRNIYSRQDDQKDTHLHIGCWRMEFDLGDPSAKRGNGETAKRGLDGDSLDAANPLSPFPSTEGGRADGSSGAGGPADNDVLLVRRIFDETTERFSQLAKPFAKNAQGEACEGSARWTPEEFTSLRIQSRARKNAHGRPIAFDLIPVRLGALRQMQPQGGTYASNMDFINYDFWVTRTESGFTSYIDVPQYASQRRPLTGYPTTVWHCSPVLHFPRSEDFGSEDGKNSYTGVGSAFWTGFYIRPRDLFDGSPLYQARQSPPWFGR
jgi:hypothetical protein